jgi:hypothetical protein
MMQSTRREWRAHKKRVGKRELRRRGIKTIEGVLALHAEGKDEDVIARRMGISTQLVRSVLAAAAELPTSARGK